GASLPLLAGLPVFAKPAPKPAAVASQAIQGLMKLFSPEIQTTIGACFDRGKVNLGAGADEDGSVICGDGFRESPVAYNTYVETYSNVLAASALVAMRTALKSNPQVRPELVIQAVNSSYGQQRLRREMRKVITESELVASNSPQSVNYLTDSILERVRPYVKTSRTFNNLLGNPDQYSQVVRNFCIPPGMAIDAAQTLVPNLAPVQLYAICIQNSGLAEEIQGRLK
ncbi:MAG: hypothetical protein SFW36_22035, partial [Leptolyngbyaceae cyanobacterium bins.59]|nr:hypothetical protein [Leptolyngbyaceae cyanobacterium bins.59]